jgi:RimJ/RimL family protein N-acetyltransferase
VGARLVARLSCRLLSEVGIWSLGCRGKDQPGGDWLQWPVYFPDIAGRPEIELGYRLARLAWGRGYATEAAHAVRDLAFTTLGLKRLIAMIDPANGASIRVAEKIGMQYEKDIVFGGYNHPDRIYSISSA